MDAMQAEMMRRELGLPPGTKMLEAKPVSKNGVDAAIETRMKLLLGGDEKPSNPVIADLVKDVRDFEKKLKTVQLARRQALAEAEKLQQEAFRIEGIINKSVSDIRRWDDVIKDLMAPQKEEPPKTEEPQKKEEPPKADEPTKNKPSKKPGDGK